MSDLDHPSVRDHYKRLEQFAQECGLSAQQLQKLITLVINLTNARATVQKRKTHEDRRPLFPGTGI